MELAKGKINDFKLSFHRCSQSGKDDKNQFYSTTTYMLYVYDQCNRLDYEKRHFNLEGDNLKVILEAKDKTGQELINLCAANIEVKNWLEDIYPTLFKQDGKEELILQSNYPETIISTQTVPGLKLPAGMNTLTIFELEEAFNRVVSANNGEIYDGIKNGQIKLEDSLPWFDISFKEKGSIKKARQLCQQLADEMNIRILFNRIECESKQFNVFGVMDIDYEEKLCDIIPALSRDGKWADFMKSYGTPILPSSVHKKVIKTKLKM